MIQHGAEEIITSTESTVTDEDIDYILKKGEEKTTKLNQKYQGLGLEDLQKFTSESAYEWQGENWSNKVCTVSNSIWSVLSTTDFCVNSAKTGRFRLCLD